MHNIRNGTDDFQSLESAYPKDHTPAHVHIIGPDAEAKFDIVTLECLENRGFSEKTLRKIRTYLEGRRKRLMEAWDEYEE